MPDSVQAADIVSITVFLTKKHGIGRERGGGGREMEGDRQTERERERDSFVVCA